MFSAMSTFLSSVARRLVPLRCRRSGTSSGLVASRRRPLFFPRGAGACLRDVGSGSPFVVVKRGRTTLRKVVKLPIRVGEQQKKRGRGGRKGGDDDDDYLLDGDDDGPCVWRRTILLGRRCQPLEFTEDIHYDCEGQRQWQPRTPPHSSSPLPMSPVRLHSSGLGYMDRA